jgi:hypothetical protein
MKRNAFFLFWLFNFIDCVQFYSNSVDGFFERFNRKAFPKDPNIINNFNSNSFQNVHDFFDSLNNSKKQSTISTKTFHSFSKTALFTYININPYTSSILNKTSTLTTTTKILPTNMISTVTNSTISTIPLKAMLNNFSIKMRSLISTTELFGLDSSATNLTTKLPYHTAWRKVSSRTIFKSILTKTTQSSYTTSISKTITFPSINNYPSTSSILKKISTLTTTAKILSTSVISTVINSATLTIPTQSILSIISTKLTNLAFSAKITTKKSVIIPSKTTNRKSTISRPIVSSSTSIITNFSSADSKKTFTSFYPITNKTIISYDTIDPNYSQTSTSNAKLSLTTPKTSVESYLKVILSIFLGVFIFAVFIILFFSRKVSNYIRNMQRRIEIAERIIQNTNANNTNDIELCETKIKKLTSDIHGVIRVSKAHDRQILDLEMETFQIKNIVDKNYERQSDTQKNTNINININDESTVFYQDNIGSHFMLDAQI